MFPEEKVRNEVAMIRYIQDHTSIPVPFILHWGTKEESPLQIGPFIIMEWINHEMDMGAALNTPGFSRNDRPVLDPNIETERLEELYRQFANIILQLSRLEFPAIGSLEQNEDQDSWAVTKRPLSTYMNELVRVGSLPRDKLPGSTYSSTREYLSALSKLHIDHFASQRTDSFDSRSDCKRKFLARQLFHKLANDGRLLSAKDEWGPSRLFFDDLRYGNILLDANLQVVGVVDWEFCYVGPAGFVSEPPWWLLLEKPEYWADGIEEWIRMFDDRLQIFLKVMEECEARSRECLEMTGRLQVVCATAGRANFAFDYIFWHKIDPKFFGDGEFREEAWQDRLALLDEETRHSMEQFVDAKLKACETRELVWEPDE
ncbi:Protein kinase-like domain protein [Cordyceps fumosorosea ARSEF 2679]|uniref:Protein kinase-like domain protein n=1 Tax=Cordyceps fumosorosea (strain ARSEF 2679) TaxID=1081104 RepID=A0A162K439_CORFA|nr:Protein kinase-like domain protein [Cordyceps fumosorosea ARSEF 2679]OAA53088.1 Protein kinase-like domain protein [Cordyceps fumosorosea ARSEF 2679]